MKVEIKETKKGAKPKYPILMKSKNTGDVYVFFATSSAVCLTIDNYTFDNFDINDFELLEGTITLSNEWTF